MYSHHYIVKLFVKLLGTIDEEDDLAVNDPGLSRASEVRLLLGNTVLPNRTMISVDDIGNTTSTGLLCQSPLNEPNIGKWLLPNDTAPPTTPSGPLFTTHEKGQIQLFRQGAITAFQGVYRCIIPDENNISQTLLVWIYESYLFTGVTSPYLISNFNIVHINTCLLFYIFFREFNS